LLLLRAIAGLIALVYERLELLLLLRCRIALLQLLILVGTFRFGCRGPGATERLLSLLHLLASCRLALRRSAGRRERTAKVPSRHLAEQHRHHGVAVSADQHGIDGVRDGPAGERLARTVLAVS